MAMDTGHRRDITESKAVADALRNSEHRYRTFIETASEGILVAQGDKLKFVNPVVTELTGYTEDELLSIPFQEFIHPDYRELMKNNHLKRILGEPVDQRYEIQIVKKDGSFRWIEISGAKIDWEAQPATLNFVSDITDRIKADEALRQSEERFRNLLQTIPTIAVQGYGPDGTTQYWNKASEKLYGYSAEEAIGRNLLDLIIPPEARGDVEQAIRYMAETGLPIPASELSLIHKDGSQVSVFSSHAIVKTLACEQELFCFDIDLSEQIKADAEKHVLEQQLLHAQKMESLGVLAGGIAHDFNNLLAVIIGHCSLARLKPTSAADNIRSIETAAERAAELCQQMLAYAGKANITKSLINIEELVDEMLGMSKSTISRNVNIICNYSPDIPLIRVDASQIRQITMNLLINASEAIGESQGEISVSLAKTVIKTDKRAIDHVGNSISPGLYACLQVTDNGCGMDSETQQRLFEPFYTTKFTGRGLGMSAVLGIIKAHNGALQLFSKPGQGTTFKVYLPIQISEFVQEPPLQLSSSLDSWKGSGTVLLVEDEEQVTLIAKVMLEELGFTVIDASNGKEALEKYQNAINIKLVMTDIGMPVMDGYTLFRELKTLNPELRIVFSSGFGETVVTSRIPIEAIAGLISKPYNFEQMREVLKSVLEGANKRC
jgi:PAS domain S-box-containing protein